MMKSFFCFAVNTSYIHLHPDEVTTANLGFEGETKWKRLFSILRWGLYLRRKNDA